MLDRLHGGDDVAARGDRARRRASRSIWWNSASDGKPVVPHRVEAAVAREARRQQAPESAAAASDVDEPAAGDAVARRAPDRPCGRSRRGSSRGSDARARSSVQRTRRQRQTPTPAGDMPSAPRRGGASCVAGIGQSSRARPAPRPRAFALNGDVDDQALERGRERRRVSRAARARRRARPRFRSRRPCRTRRPAGRRRALRRRRCRTARARYWPGSGRSAAASRRRTSSRSPSHRTRSAMPSASAASRSSPRYSASAGRCAPPTIPPDPARDARAVARARRRAAAWPFHASMRLT